MTAGRRWPTVGIVDGEVIVEQPHGGPPWGWPYRRRGRLRMTVALAAIQVLGTMGAARGQPEARPLGVLGIALLLAGPALLLARRRYPAPVMLAVTAVTLAYALAGYPFGPFFLALAPAVFAAAAAGYRALTWATLAVAYLAYLVLGRLVHSPWLAAPSLGRALGVGLVLAWLAVFAEGARVRGRYLAELSRARAEQRRARAELERRRADDERLRIARELHDVLGHHLSLINVQAGVGLHLMDSQPDQARTALVNIRQASAEALREVRGVLDALHPDEESAPRSPAAGLADLPDLLDNAGVPVRTETAGHRRELPAEVDRAAYRIVREALTNVRRHAGAAATVTVRLDYRPDALELCVDDDGAGAEPAAAPGTGIAGMRERAAALGGTLTAGTRPQGGFRVHARLPTDTS
jgi:signal transduction histidine kinase